MSNVRLLAFAKQVNVPRILLIPDVYGTLESGSLCAHRLAAVMQKQGWQVAVFAPDVEDHSTVEGVPTFRRRGFRATANYAPARYAAELQSVIGELRPSHIFSVGGVINRPICYFDVIERSGIPHLYLILCQDFYCSRIHAALPSGPCRKCLDGSKLHAFANHCAIKTTHDKTAYLANNTVNRIRLQRRLPKLTWALGSTQEQLDMMAASGVPRERLLYFPLPFPPDRVDGIVTSRGTDIVIAGQARVEKGIHLLRNVLPNEGGPRISIAFARRGEGERALHANGLMEFVESGRLLPHFGVEWANGLKELYAQSLGVLILSIWPTTTEFAFLEALGMRKPVLCFDLGVHAEQIVTGQNGFKVPLGDYEQLKGHMKSLQDSPELYQTVSAGARALFHDLTDDAQLIRWLAKAIH